MADTDTHISAQELRETQTQIFEFMGSMNEMIMEMKRIQLDSANTQAQSQKNMENTLQEIKAALKSESSHQELKDALTNMQTAFLDKQLDQKQERTIMGMNNKNQVMLKVLGIGALIAGGSMGGGALFGGSCNGFQQQQSQQIAPAMEQTGYGSRKWNPPPGYESIQNEPE